MKSEEIGRLGKFIHFLFLLSAFFFMYLGVLVFLFSLFSNFTYFLCSFRSSLVISLIPFYFSFFISSPTSSEIWCSSSELSDDSDEPT